MGNGYRGLAIFSALLLIFAFQNCSESPFIAIDTHSQTQTYSSVSGNDSEPEALVSSTFIPMMGLQEIGKDGNYIPGENTRRGPVFVKNKIFVGYMTNGANGTNTGLYEIIAAMYDYSTGVWTKKLVASIARSGNDGHNSPSIHIGPSGIVEIYYGSLTCGSTGYGYNGSGPMPGYGPCYKKSLKPYSIDEFGPEENVTSRGSLNNIIGGFTPDGELHLMGQGVYTRRGLDGQWTPKYQMLPNFSGGAVGIPGSIQDTLIVGSTIHFVFSVYNGSGAGRRLYYTKSNDGGNTWTNINGTQSFQVMTGLSATGVLDTSWHPTILYPAYPAAYQIHAGNTSSNPEVEVLSDGTVVVAEGDGFRFHRWLNNAWQTTTIAGQIYALEVAMNKLSDDTLVIHAVNGLDYSIVEFVSRDKGVTWSRTVIHSRAGESQQKSLEAVVAKPPGQKERVIVQWHRMFANPAHSEVAVMERIF